MESIYTRWVQGYLLPKIFGIDKRKMHLSTLICAGTMTRANALKVGYLQPYSPALQVEGTIAVKRKFELLEEEFNRIMQLPIQRFTDYESYETSLPYTVARKITQFVR